MNERCFEHSGFEARLKSIESSEEEQWKSINKAHSRVDGIKNWVIAGMSSVLIQLILAILSLLLKSINK